MNEINFAPQKSAEIAHEWGWRHTTIFQISLLLACTFFTLSSQTTFACDEPLKSSSPAKLGPPSKALEQLVAESFSVCHDGWSVDEVLLRDDLRADFSKKCYEGTSNLAPVKQEIKEHVESGHTAEDLFCHTLLHVRKRGGQLPKATKRSSSKAKDEVTSIAEIAARRIHDETGNHTDLLLTNSMIRERFDEIVESIMPGCSKYEMRKAALRLRKSRRLEPELLSRVTDWQRTIKEYPSAELAKATSKIPTRPGIYIFRDSTGYLYIGQADNLRTRLKKHLTSSDRQALADYLQSTTNTGKITIELHIFEKGSPGENLRIRRAYESELIRTRKPKLNIAP